MSLEDFGWQPANIAMFDGCFLCPICAAVVSMKNDGLAKHERWHSARGEL